MFLLTSEKTTKKSGRNKAARRNDRLHDGGKFYFVATGTTDNRTDITLDANLHASMGYETGLF